MRPRSVVQFVRPRFTRASSENDPVSLVADASAGAPIGWAPEVSLTT